MSTKGPLSAVVVQGGEVYDPGYIGRASVVCVSDKIAHIGDAKSSDVRVGSLESSGIFDVDRVDATDCYVVPGFIDGHVHITGGGGEGGPHTRTPEITLTALTTTGITTVVGLLGTDGVTRSVPELLAKARGLENEGVSTYIYTGAYEIPTRTVTGQVRADLVLIDKIIGVGEIAIADHRSAQPETFELSRLAAEARVGGLLGGKAGVVHLHVGRSKRGLRQLFELIDNTELPVTQFIPTHVNRTRFLFEQAREFRRRGGTIDLTAGVSPELGEDGSVSPSRAFEELLAEGESLDGVTLSSDGNGSLPTFDEAGNLVDIQVGPVSILLDEIRQAVVDRGIPLETVLPVVTSNVAKSIRLYPKKGTLLTGCDADVVVLTPDLAVKDVIAKGRILVRDGQPTVLGTYE